MDRPNRLGIPQHVTGPVTGASAIAASGVDERSRSPGHGLHSFLAKGNCLYLGVNRSETEAFVENAITIIRSRLFPGFVKYFPGSGAKIPDCAATGIHL